MYRNFLNIITLIYILFNISIVWWLRNWGTKWTAERDKPVWGCTHRPTDRTAPGLLLLYVQIDKLIDRRRIGGDATTARARSTRRPTPTRYSPRQLRQASSNLASRADSTRQSSSSRQRLRLLCYSKQLDEDRIATEERRRNSSISDYLILCLVWFGARCVAFNLGPRQTGALARAFRRHRPVRRLSFASSSSTSSSSFWCRCWWRHRTSSWTNASFSCPLPPSPTPTLRGLEPRICSEHFLRPSPHRLIVLKMASSAPSTSRSGM